MKTIRTVLLISALTTAMAMANTTKVLELDLSDRQTEKVGTVLADGMNSSYERPDQSRGIIVAGDAPCNPKVTVCDD